VINTTTIKKFVLPNLPYVFLFWLFDKCGEAYRLAPGSDILHKLTATTAMLNTTIARPMPSFDTFDLLVGLIGAAAIFGAVQYKKRNSRKWRKDVLRYKGWQ
jgi:type IV secretion system protein VirD4